MNYQFDYSQPPTYFSGFPSPKEMRNKPKVTGIQRRAANDRERKRMKSINKGFDTLRNRLPLTSTERKLSKVDTLKYAAKYIEQLIHLLEEPKKHSGQSKFIIRPPGSKGHPIFLVSWQKTPEHGQIHHTAQGPKVFQKAVWHPSK